MKKIELVLNLIRDNPGWLTCPVCGAVLHSGSGNVIACEKHHSFDLSASGSLNLLSGKPPEDYGAAMLESRKLVCRAGLFNVLLDAVASLLISYGFDGQRRLLDAGCGEGSQLMMLKGLMESHGVPVTAIGADISKDAIRIAAREHAGALWLVADLAKLPLAEQSTDVILNILSPINYGEFRRILTNDGIVIKVVPGSGYLKELRQKLYAGEDRERYTNDPVVSLFEQRFHEVAAEHVRQQFPVLEGLWPHIVAMTPLSWDVGEQKQAEALAAPPPSVTLDFLVMVGKKR